MATSSLLTGISFATHEHSSVLACTTVLLRENQLYAAVSFAAVMYLSLPHLAFLLTTCIDNFSDVTCPCADIASSPCACSPSVSLPPVTTPPEAAPEPEPEPVLPDPAGELLAAVQEGLSAGQAPLAAEAGLGGAMLMKSAQGDTIAVFKPHDQEYGCEGNRKGYNSPSLGGAKRGIPAGEGYLREHAAYLLDPDYVPTTTIASIQVPGANAVQMGSLQAYVPHDCDAEEIGTGTFPVDEVHKLALLDLRLGNSDRHLGNILVQNGGERLVPIDHGSVLPTSLADLYFGWQFWSQASRPLSPEMLARVAGMDPATDTEKLRAAVPGLSDEALLVGEVCSSFTKAALSNNRRTVRAVADMMTRGLEDSPSMLEKLCARAAASLSGSDTGAWDASKWCGDRRAAFLAALAQEIEASLGV